MCYFLRQMLVGWFERDIKRDYIVTNGLLYTQV
jgi:hypothetical protein